MPAAAGGLAERYYMPGGVCEGWGRMKSWSLFPVHSAESHQFHYIGGLFLLAKIG